MLSPFQRTLVEAVLRRYQANLGAEQLENGFSVDRCLWIDWSTGTVSMSEKEGFAQFICDSPAHRAATIKALTRKHVQNH